MSMVPTSSRITRNGDLIAAAAFACAIASLTACTIADTTEDRPERIPDARPLIKFIPMEAICPCTPLNEERIERDPTLALVRPKSQRRDERRPLSFEETQKVLEVARTNEEGLILGVLYYLGLRRGEALGLKWRDFDFKENQVHIERDIDYAGSTAQEGSLKTLASERYVPIPAELKDMLLPKRGRADEYVFHTAEGKPLSESTFKRMWYRLMFAADLVEWREVKPGTGRANDILKCVKPVLTPHYFRHNYVTLLYESGVDPLIAMKIVGHSNYQTTANIYTHLKEDAIRRATVNLNSVFERGDAEE